MSEGPERPNPWGEPFIEWNNKRRIMFCQSRWITFKAEQPMFILEPAPNTRRCPEIVPESPVLVDNISPSPCPLFGRERHPAAAARVHTDVLQKPQHLPVTFLWSPGVSCPVVGCPGVGRLSLETPFEPYHTKHKCVGRLCVSIDVLESLAAEAVSWMPMSQFTQRRYAAGTEQRSCCLCESSVQP